MKQDFTMRLGHFNPGRADILLLVKTAWVPEFHLQIRLSRYLTNNLKMLDNVKR